MDETKIARINELARKAKEMELSAEEKAEQAKLRGEYILAVKANLKSQLDNIDVKEEDGTVVNLGEKYGEKSNEKNTH